MAANLQQENLFGGVHGGNVLDDEHIDSMIAALEGFPPGEKAAVCFFFHEHVTAILKHPVKDGQQRSTYELVDSLPQAPSGMGVRIKCEDHAVLKVSPKNKNKKSVLLLIINSARINLVETVGMIA